MTTLNDKPAILTLDHIPTLISKFASILWDEANRIEALAATDRKASDIKLARDCLSSLAVVNRDFRAEKESISKEIKLLPPEQVKAIVNKRN